MSDYVVTSDDIIKLHKKTGSSSYNCLFALHYNDGNEEEAIQWLKENTYIKGTKLRRDIR